jgi:predicted  nucleic acid-binding Zn-ribbon protein
VRIKKKGGNMTPNSILNKNLIDAKKAELAVVENSIRKKQESIESCNTYLRINIGCIDSADVRETEDEIRTYETEIEDLTVRKSQLNQEIANLQAAGFGGTGIIR